MECPYCKNDMIKGKLLGSQLALKWIPDGQKLTMWGFTHYEGEIILNDSKSGWIRPYKESYLCKECKKLISDV